MSDNPAAVIHFSRHSVEMEAQMTPAEKCISGQPEQRTWNHYESTDEQFFSGIWEADPGCWRVNYTEHEFCHILAGVSVLRDEAGNSTEVKTGDSFVIPAGFVGEWEVVETTKKAYAIFLSNA